MGRPGYRRATVSVSTTSPGRRKADPGIGDLIGWAPHISIWLSLVVIVCVLAVATMASLAKASLGARADA